jgi:hypothetical protein
MEHAAPCGGLAALGRARAVLSVVALGGTLIRRTAAEEIAVLVEELKPLLAQLQALLPEPVADPTSGTSTHHKVTGSPAPWHGEAGPLLMTIHAGVRDLEVDLKYAVTGSLPEDRWAGGRGRSDGNTVKALDAIAKLAFGVPESVAKKAAGELLSWVTQARQIRDISESEKWIPIHVPRGQLPPACPYCKTYSVRIAQESGRVAYSNAACVDSEGNRPRGRIDRNRLDGSAMLIWSDGRSIYYGEAS